MRDLANTPLRVAILLYLAGCLIGFLRNPLLFIYPIASFEDGTEGIGFYSRPGAPVLHVYNGYVQALPDVISWVTVNLAPLAWAPYFFTLSALAISALIPIAVYNFNRHALRLGLRPALVSAILIACLPLGDWPMISNSYHAIWPIAAVLLLNLGNPVPVKPPSWLFYVGWRVVFFASNPLALPAMAAWGIMAGFARSPQAHLAALTLLGAGVIYALLGISHAPSNAETGVGATLHVAAMALHLAVEKCLLDFLPIAPVLPLLQTSVGTSVLAAIGSAIVVLVLVIRVRRAKEKQWTAVVTGLSLACIGALCLICAAGRGAEKGQAYLLDAPRYAYVPTLLWFALIAAAMADLWRADDHGGTAGSAAMRRLSLVAIGGLCVAMICHVRANQYDWDDPTQSRKIRHFLSVTQAAMQAGATGPFRFTRIQDQLDWSIVLSGPNLRPSPGSAPP